MQEQHDEWYSRAIAVGIERDLAQLVRELMRNQAQLADHPNGWVGPGAPHHGNLLIAMCQAAPISTELRVACDLQTPLEVSGREVEWVRKALAERLGGEAVLADIMAAEKPHLDLARKAHPTSEFYQLPDGRVSQRPLL